MSHSETKALLTRQIAAQRREMARELRQVQDKVSPAQMAFKMGRKIGPALLATRTAAKVGGTVAKGLTMGGLLKGGLLIGAPLIAWKLFSGSEEEAPLPPPE